MRRTQMFGSTFPCPDCGVVVAKAYASSHTCDPAKMEDHLVQKFAKDLKTAGLTQRMQRHLDFLEWCRVNGRP